MSAQFVLNLSKLECSKEPLVIRKNSLLDKSVCWWIDILVIVWRIGYFLQIHRTILRERLYLQLSMRRMMLFFLYDDIIMIMIDWLIDWLIDYLYQNILLSYPNPQRLVGWALPFLALLPRVITDYLFMFVVGWFVIFNMIFNMISNNINFIDSRVGRKSRNGWIWRKREGVESYLRFEWDEEEEDEEGVIVFYWNTCYISMFILSYDNENEDEQVAPQVRKHKNLSNFIWKAMLFWVAAWFCIVICVTTLNKTLFTTLKCPYPVSITFVSILHLN